MTEWNPAVAEFCTGCTAWRAIPAGCGAASALQQRNSNCATALGINPEPVTHGP